MPIPTIEWSGGKIKLIDQTKLPHRLQFLCCKDLETLWKAIKTLKVRGAPALGVAACLGVVLGVGNSKAKDYQEFKIDLDKTIDYLSSSRPTAVNLFWGLERMRQMAQANSDKPIPKLKKILLSEALRVIQEDKELCRRIARFGSRLIKDGDRILTICNAGALATADYGTALGLIYRAKEEGKSVKVYTCETRPLLQGSRLTTWELKREKIDVTLLCDNMAAELMQRHKIDKVIVGADRIAANGDTANKIGTYNLAVLAKFHKIPFYCCAPFSSFDLSLNDGNQIPIEFRDGEEVVEIFGRRIAPWGIKVYNPAFDVTPNKLISAIVTDKGIIRPPYKKNIRKIFSAKG
jgi:methylthioribose-1-phosphate isomerase